MDKIPSRPTPTFLIVCFILNVLFVPVFIYVVATFELSVDYLKSSEFQTKQGVLAIFAGGATILWIYCIYFYYKYDKYFKGGFGLLVLPGLISAFYFYKVIWKQKRPLQNK